MTFDELLTQVLDLLRRGGMDVNSDKETCYGRR
jgi:hypothetical protein